MKLWPISLKKKLMAVQVGIEPTTKWLTVTCSTAELLSNSIKDDLKLFYNCQWRKLEKFIFQNLFSGNAIKPPAKVIWKKWGYGLVETCETIQCKFNLEMQLKGIEKGEMTF